MAIKGLSTAQTRALAAMPDWIGVGLPADVIGGSRSILKRLCDKGYAERERPNEEWPTVYASTATGRLALKDQTP